MNDHMLRAHLLQLLTGGHAHLDFEAAIADLPVESRGAKPPGLPHTPWRLLEHMRIAQWDILRFSIDSRHVSPEFPAGYWPEGDAPSDPGAWDRTVDAFRADLKAMIDLMGALLLLLPFMVVLMWFSAPYVARSFAILERSRESSGLPIVYLLKGLIPVFAFLLALQGVSQAIHAANVLLRGNPR